MSGRLIARFNSFSVLLFSAVGSCLIVPTEIQSLEKEVSTCVFWVAATNSARGDFKDFEVAAYAPISCEIDTRSSDGEKYMLCALPPAKDPVAEAQKLAATIAACLPTAKFYRPRMPSADGWGAGSQVVRVAGSAVIEIEFGKSSWGSGNMYAWISKDRL